MNVHSAIDAAISGAKAAVDLLNAKFQSLPTPLHATSKMTPGEIMRVMAAQSAAPADFTSVARRASKIRRDTEAAMKSAEAQLDEARRIIDEWLHLSDVLKGAAVLGDTTSKHADDVRVLQEAVAAGAITAAEVTGLSKAIERDALEASKYLAHEVDRMERIKSAAGVAVANAAARAFKQRAGDEGYTATEKALLERAAKLHAGIAAKRKMAHANRFFSEAEKAKTFGGVEYRHSGVKV